MTGNNTPKRSMIIGMTIWLVAQFIVVFQPGFGAIGEISWLWANAQFSAVDTALGQITGAQLPATVVSVAWALEYVCFALLIWCIFRIFYGKKNMAGWWGYVGAWVALEGVLTACGWLLIRSGLIRIE